MTEFEYLKNCYITTVQFGLLANTAPEELRNGNEILHKFCENFVDGSNYGENEKHLMKLELQLTKECLSKEIDAHYKNK
jgi:hypothetical protein